MKKLIILLLWACPCLAFSQAMHLPGASIPVSTDDAVKLAPFKPQFSKLTPSVKAQSVATADTSKAAGGITGDGTTTNPIKYSANVLNTNFIVPLVRINMLSNNPQNATNSNVSTSYFNSVGAGVNYSWGELDETLDKNGNTASADYYNHYGIHAGFIFAANTAAGSSTTTSASTSNTTTQSGTIFAVVAAFTFYNFQVGTGYDFGSVPVGQKRLFFTLNYAIPVTTFVAGGYKIIKATLMPATTSN